VIIEFKNIIYMHPGKTGGTSIEHFLKNKYLNNKKLNAKVSDQDIMFGYSEKYKFYLQHADLRFYANFINKNLKKYTTITSVRNPYDRLVSCYFYNGKDKKFTFEDFVLNHLEKHITPNKNYAINHFCPQINFIKYNDYTVNKIIKFESFIEDCKKCGLDIKQKLSKTIKRKKDYNIYYNNKTKDIVYNLYKEDFEYLNYNK